MEEVPKFCITKILIVWQDVKFSPSLWLCDCPPPLVDKHESLETQSRATVTTFYFYNDSSAIALVWVYWFSWPSQNSTLSLLRISLYLVLKNWIFICESKTEVLYQKVKVKKFTRESESWKLKTRLFRSPGESERWKLKTKLQVPRRTQMTAGRQSFACSMDSSSAFLLWPSTQRSRWWNQQNSSW